MKFSSIIVIISFLILGLGTTNAQSSWKPKPRAGFKLSDGGWINCGWTVAFIDTSVILNPCNPSGDSCDTITDWFWSFGDGRTSKLKNPVENYNWGPIFETGHFNVKLIIKTKFGFSDSIKYQSIYLAEPMAGFAVMSDSIVEVGDSVTFLNQSKLYSKPNWEWNFGDGNILIDKSKRNVVHAYMNPGKYEIYLTLHDTINAFNDEKVCKTISPDLALNERKISITVNKAVKTQKYPVSKITFFPNPTENFVFFKGIDNGEIIIYDPIGQEVLRSQINKQVLDISALRNGSYLIKLTNEDLNWNAFLIKK